MRELKVVFWTSINVQGNLAQKQWLHETREGITQRKNLESKRTLSKRARPSTTVCTYKSASSRQQQENRAVNFCTHIYITCGHLVWLVVGGCSAIAGAVPFLSNVMRLPALCNIVHYRTLMTCNFLQAKHMQLSYVAVCVCSWNKNKVVAAVWQETSLPYSKDIHSRSALGFGFNAARRRVWLGQI